MRNLPDPRAAVPSAELLSPDTKVGGYVLEVMLAQGGMGAVYRAHHAVLARCAAVKVLHAHMVDATSRARVLQEARILEAIEHPAMVTVFDAGELPDGRPWIAMELLEGKTLAEHLDDVGALPIDEAIDVLIALADVLEVAHQHGVVHRDVKPDNVMLVSGAMPRVKLIDWGIARAGARRRVTEAGTTAGTPEYMAPEQVRGRAVDGRTDVYALGVVAYELLSGLPPFCGASSLEIAVQHVTSEPRAIRVAHADIPAALDDLILAMLAKAPADRPSLAEVRGRLAAARGAAPLAEELWPECVLDGAPMPTAEGDDDDEPEIEIVVSFDDEVSGTAPTELALPIMPRPRWTPRVPIPAAVAEEILSATTERLVEDRARTRGDVRRGREIIAAPRGASACGEIDAREPRRAS